MSDTKVSLNQEVKEFATADQVALGDLEIRRKFADRIVWLFIVSNTLVLIGLGVAFWVDCAQMSAKLIQPGQRIIDGKVVMTALGATTVQLGTVVLTIARAVFIRNNVKKPKKNRAKGQRAASDDEKI